MRVLLISIKMMSLTWTLTGILILCFIAWMLLSLPKDIPNTEGSIKAIDNVGNWMTQFLGSNWPYVLTFIILMLLVILYLLNVKEVLSISDAAAGQISKALTLLTVGVTLLMTLSWRQAFVMDASYEYYIELGLIFGLMALNIYLA